MIKYKILVCGGRDFADKEYLYSVLDSILAEHKDKTLVVVHGAARGADSLAGQWAKDRNIECEEYPAKWNLYGRQAGYLRNIEMLECSEPDIVIAFPGGRGTDMMINIAKKAFIPVKEY